MSKEETTTGAITLISGPMVAAENMPGVTMGEIVLVGEARIMGEVIRIDGHTVYAQVFESTQGMRLGEPVASTGSPLSVELGPGLLGSTYDGIQRPLPAVHESSGDFIGRGVTAEGLDRNRRWAFTPSAEVGDEVGPGDVLGTVPETDTLKHKILVPPGMQGRLVSVVVAGEYTGGVSGTPCFQHGKVERLHSWLQRERLDLRDSWFYSDSHNDLPLLEQVDHPVAVDPDDRLDAHARSRGWPIISLR